MKIIDCPSPNHGERKGVAAPDMIILHYTGMKTAQESLDRLRDPVAEVSAHYLIDTDGTVYRLVDEERRAWHAGKSFWQGETDINSRSIGIEIQNPGHDWGYEDFPDAQIDSVIGLCRDIMARHGIHPARVLGHSDVAPERKNDPGEKFPWKKLAQSGIGLFPSADLPEATGGLHESLIALGYDPQASFGAVRRAFYEHWQPESDEHAVRIARWLWQNRKTENSA